MEKIIIGFAGPLASGKDVCRKYILEKYEADSTKFSLVLRDILTRLYLPISRENLQTLSLDLRNRFGSDILAQVILKDINNSSKEIVIIDGVRRLEDIECFQGLPGFYLISVSADPLIRYERLKARNENAGDAEKTYQNFLADCDREAEKEIPAVMKTAKFNIDNNGSFEDLYQQLEKIMLEIKNLRLSQAHE